VGVADTRVEDIVRDGSKGIGVSDADAMLNFAVRSKVPVILMHSRGPANANKDYSSFGEGGVMEGVRTELELRVGRALRAGVRRWNVVLDPGIGFSKSVEDNLQLVRRHAQLTQPHMEGSTLPLSVEHNLPVSPVVNLERFATLVGTSRKGYLGHVLGHPEALMDARKREWGTAAAVAAAVQQGVDIVRVHSVQAMRDVVKVADAIWRS
jgi:dihydroneopterin aldolase/2-amino-4-hydroxy-6-hydroxymethyldihydropteridine diphosphokinase/dihydropteroate synthase